MWNLPRRRLKMSLQSLCLTFFFLFFFLIEGLTKTPQVDFNPLPGHLEFPRTKAASWDWRQTNTFQWHNCPFMNEKNREGSSGPLARDQQVWTRNHLAVKREESPGIEMMINDVAGELTVLAAAFYCQDQNDRRHAVNDRSMMSWN